MFVQRLRICFWGRECSQSAGLLYKEILNHHLFISVGFFFHFFIVVSLSIFISTHFGSFFLQFIIYRGILEGNWNGSFAGFWGRFLIISSKLKLWWKVSWVIFVIYVDAAMFLFTVLLWWTLGLESALFGSWSWCCKFFRYRFGSWNQTKLWVGCFKLWDCLFMILLIFWLLSQSQRIFFMDCYFKIETNTSNWISFGEICLCRCQKVWKILLSSYKLL